MHRRAILPLSGSCYVGPMRERGEGSGEQLVTGQRGPGGRWFGLLLSCAAACAPSSNSSETGRGASASESAQFPHQSRQRSPEGSTQQVVQRIAPTPVAPSGGAAGSGAAQTVTAKHVEAELNRLEAELK